jgi:hypothetical protein
MPNSILKIIGAGEVPGLVPALSRMQGQKGYCVFPPLMPQKPTPAILRVQTSEETVDRLVRDFPQMTHRVFR